MKLTQEQKRIKIAKEHGFSVIFNEEKKLFELLNPEGKWAYPYDADGESEEHCWSYCPDYFNDLNACHEMEKTLTRKTKHSPFNKYLTQLNDLSCSSQCSGNQGICGDTTCATATQRAEAFGLTLNLWTAEE